MDGGNLACSKLVQIGKNEILDSGHDFSLAAMELFERRLQPSAFWPTRKYAAGRQRPQGLSQSKVAPFGTTA